MRIQMIYAHMPVLMGSSICVLDSATQAHALLGSSVPSLPHSPTRQSRSVSPSVPGTDMLVRANNKPCGRPLELPASFQSLLEANDDDGVLAGDVEGGGDGEQQRGGAGGWELAGMDADLYCAVRRPASRPGIDLDCGEFLHVVRSVRPQPPVHASTRSACKRERERESDSEREREREKVY
jgi:hypothetical protein